MEITVHINAPELVGAINTLAAALEAGNFKMTTAAMGVDLVDPTNAVLVPVNPTPVQTAPQVAPAPVDHTTLTTASATAPVAPVSQQVINQANPVNPTPAPAQPMVQPTAPVAQAVPTAAPSYTMEQLAVAATQLVDAGQRDNLVALLGQFGVQALNVLPKEQYGNFANALRGMGAKL